MEVEDFAPNRGCVVAELKTGFSDSGAGLFSAAAAGAAGEPKMETEGFAPNRGFSGSGAGLFSAAAAGAAGEPKMEAEGFAPNKLTHCTYVFNSLLSDGRSSEVRGHHIGTTPHHRSASSGIGTRLFMGISASFEIDDLGLR